MRWIGVRDTQWMNDDDEIVQFLGKPDEQGELRDMDFAWEIDYHEQSK